MKFKKYNLVFNKNGFFNGEIVTNSQFTYEDFSHEKPDPPIVTSSMYFFVGYSEDTGRFSDLFIKGKDADSRSYNFRWDGSRFLPAEGNTEIDLINSGFVKDYSEVEEWDSFVAELNKFQKILMKEVDRNVIKDLKTQSDKFTQTCEFQSLLADKMTNVDAKTKALIKSLFEQDCTMEKIELIARDDLNAEQCCEIYFGIVSDLSLEELEISAKPEFNDKQMSELCTSLANKIPAEIVRGYADVCFSAEQLSQIRKGFEDGLSVEDVGLYTRPSLTPEQMGVYRHGYSLGLTRDELSGIPSLAPNMMFSLVKKQAEEKDKQRFLDSGSEYLGLLSSTGEKDKFRVSNLQDLSFNTQFEIWRALEREKKNVSTLEGSLESVLSELRADEQTRQVRQER